MDTLTHTKPKILLRENYLAMIEGSINAHMFRHLYAEVGGEVKDLAGDGQRSCALYASSILYHFKLIGALRATVSSFLADIKDSGWHETGAPLPGDIVEWAPALQGDGQLHGHVGFYWTAEQAVSHSDRERVPTYHDLLMLPPNTGETGRGRNVMAIYTHPLLRQ